MKVHGKSYSPVDDARFKSGIPSVLNIAQDNNAVTPGLYDIRFNPARVNLNGGKRAPILPYACFAELKKQIADILCSY